MSCLRVSGGLLGRALGVGMVYIWQDVTGTSNPVDEWKWMDPGVIAALGSAALLGGVNRLEVASTVIVVRKTVIRLTEEITDLAYLCFPLRFFFDCSAFLAAVAAAYGIL